METRLETQEILTVERVRIWPFRNQPRKHFDPDALRQLAESIAAEGQRTPAEAKRLTDDPLHDYELADGERRWRACELAGVTTFRIWINAYASEDEQFISSVVANFGREGHTPIETARAIARILETPRYAAGTKTERLERVAKLFAKSVAWVYLHLNLLELHPEIQAMLGPDAPEKKRLGLSMAGFLHGIKDKDLQLAIAHAIAKQDLKLNQARRLARKMAEEAGAQVGSGRNKPSDAHRTFVRFLERLSESTDAVLELPKRGFADALKKRTRQERQVLMAQLDEGIARLQELKEVIKRA
jgi:ParB family chromosome partitioning protein